MTRKYESKKDKRKREIKAYSKFQDACDDFALALEESRKATSTITRADIIKNRGEVLERIALITDEYVKTSVAISTKSARQAHKSLKRNQK